MIYGNNGQTCLSNIKRDLSVDMVAIAKRKAAESLKPSKPQLPADHGLFSDDSLQTDLIEILMDPHP